jgi:hypothetical protein
MKKLLLLLLFPTLLFSQNNCYSVKSVTTEIEMEEISQRRITFGIKQMMEDIISDKYDLCMDGNPIEVKVISIQAPTTGVSIGPWTKVSKKTIVILSISMDGKVIEVEGKAKSTVKATFIDLQNDKLPFNKTTFSSAIKKAIEKAI